MSKNGFLKGLIVLILFFVGLYSHSDQARAEEPLKIGAIFDLTGFLAPIGSDSQKGAVVAFEQAGYKVGGKQVQFVWEDGGSDPATTMDKARKLVEVDKVKVIIGPIHSGAALGMASYLDKVKVPDISIAFQPDEIALEHGWMFLTGGLLRQGAYASGVYAYQKLGYRTAATICQDYVAGHEFIAGFNQGFEESGGKIVQNQRYPQGTKDFTPYFVAIKKADCLAGWFPGADAFAALPQYRNIGIKMPMILPEDGGIAISPPAMKELGDSIKGIVVNALYCYTANTPGNADFVKAYQKKWNALPGPMSGAAYASSYVAMEGLRKCSDYSSPEALREALTGVSIDTVRGHISFTSDRVAVYTAFMVRVDDKLIPNVVAEYRVKGERVGNKMVVGLVK
jgi:branched-chain amino acid transport system substrate-binding protein